MKGERWVSPRLSPRLAPEDLFMFLDRSKNTITISVDRQGFNAEWNSGKLESQSCQSMSFDEMISCQEVNPKFAIDSFG